MELTKIFIFLQRIFYADYCQVNIICNVNLAYFCRPTNKDALRHISIKSRLSKCHMSLQIGYNQSDNKIANQLIPLFMVGRGYRLFVLFDYRVGNTSNKYGNPKCSE